MMEKSRQMVRTVEVLLYTLKAGEGQNFHRIMQKVSVPLHKSSGMDVIAYGNSLHDMDSYYLIRAYDSPEHLKIMQEEFYNSDGWLNGPRKELVARIETGLKSLLFLSNEAIEQLRISATENFVSPVE